MSRACIANCGSTENHVLGVGMMRFIATVAFAVMLAMPIRAEEARAQFAASNMIAVFYHEFGHALVDLLDIPVLGREEDAVDALATLLIDLLWEEEDAPLLIADVAYGYALRIAQGDDLDDSIWWGEHSLDEQRFAAMVCQFYGADPEPRAALAADLGMPEEMSDNCIAHAEQMAESWAVFLAALDGSGSAAGLDLLAQAGDDALAAVLRTEIDLVNARFNLPETVVVAATDCDEANAFYDLAERQITICAGLAQWYAEMWDADTDG